MPVVPAAPAPLAYSYIRFSTPEQRQGDSLRRQTEAVTDWCLRNGARMDTTTTFRDRGRSAYTGDHRTGDRGALAAFLRLVETGRVPRGSFLILENLDRLSREDEVPATHLLTGILLAGVRVVQLRPAEITFTDKSNAFDIMRAVLELSRGHGESAIKSERLSQLWEQKRRLAREADPAKRQLLTRQLPAWLEERGGELHLVPERAAAIRRIFRLAAAGHGHTRTARELSAAGVPAFGDRESYTDEEGRARFRHKAGVPFGSGRWTTAYVGRILNDRRAVGECRPGSKGDKTEPPIPHYFPPVVTEAEWLAARAAAGVRRTAPPTPRPKFSCLWSGLLHDAVGGGGYYSCSRTKVNRRRRYHTRILINNDACEGRAPWRTFPLQTFERAVLAMLLQMDPLELLPDDDEVPHEVLAIRGSLGAVKGKVAELADQLEYGDIAALAAVLRRLEARERELTRRLERAIDKLVLPKASAWKQVKALAAALDAAEDQDDVRLRLRYALRQVIESVWLLVTHRCQDAFCAAQVFFQGSSHTRTLTILHRPPRDNRRPSGDWGARQPGRWWAFSRRVRASNGRMDLRDRAEAALLAEALPDAALRAADDDLKAREALATTKAVPQISRAQQVTGQAKRLKRMRARIEQLAVGTTVPPEKVARYREELARFDQEFEPLKRDPPRPRPARPGPAADDLWGVGDRIAAGVIE